MAQMYIFTKVNTKNTPIFSLPAKLHITIILTNTDTKQRLFVAQCRVLQTFFPGAI